MATGIEVLSGPQIGQACSMARVTTKTGDTGYTGLLGAGRVPKYHPRPEALGAVDEATSSLGVARATSDNARVKEVIYAAQQDLYILMAELATTEAAAPRVGYTISEEHVSRLEETIEALKREVDIPSQFVIPGETVPGAALDVARTIVRRAERRVVKLFHDEMVKNGELVRYLNRLSDVLYVLARYEEVTSTGQPVKGVKMGRRQTGRPAT